MSNDCLRNRGMPSDGVLSIRSLDGLQFAWRVIISRMLPKSPPYARPFGAAVILVTLVFAAACSLRNPGPTWETFSELHLESARHSRRPVLIEFHADWCIPCQQLERTTLKDDTVVDATKRIVRLKVDLTDFDSPENEPLKKQFDISGIPTLVFLKADGSEDIAARLVGFATPAEVIASVKSSSGR
jgi:thiol:disulfide interchange protein